MMRPLTVLIVIVMYAVCAFAQARSITVITEPSATVWIDGQRYGITDPAGKFQIRVLSGGAHTIRVRADGFKEKSQAITSTARGDIKVLLVKTNDPADLAFQEAERLATEDREKAIAAYKKAIKLRPQFPEAYLALARIQLDNGDAGDAQASIAALRKLRPGLPEASAVEGRINKENGEEAKAIASFKRAITEGKGVQPEAFTGLGLLFKERAEGLGGQGDVDGERAAYNEAAKYFQSAAKQLGSSPDAMVILQLLGLVYERTGQNAKAIATYNEFLRLFPGSVEATAVQSFIVQLRKQMEP